MQKIPLIAVVGPTASGKTALGIELAKLYNGEIISADSMQIYKGIDIAAATPTISEMQGIPHHLINFLDINEDFSVADYVNLANIKIDEVYSRGRQPILVGGTGLYVNSLIDGIEFVPEQTDIELRKKLTEKMQKIGAQAMLEELATFDPQTAQKLHPNNTRRIIRAFEVYMQTGITFYETNIKSKQTESRFNTTIIGITCKNREKLYERINLRVDKMIEKGLVEEAKTTFDLKKGRGAAQAIGHKELYEYFCGEATLQEAVEHLKMQTRRYAKRQLTWFNRRQDINWIFTDLEDPLVRAKQIIEGGKKIG